MRTTQLDLKVDELKGSEIKNKVKASKVKKTYENKHKNGSGNFGYVVIFGDIGVNGFMDNQKWYRIDGDYLSDKKINVLEVSAYGSGTIEDEPYIKKIYDSIIEIAEKKANVSLYHAVTTNNKNVTNELMKKVNNGETIRIM